VTTLALYGGPLKREIIARAYGICGQSTSDLDLTPEEMVVGLRCMNEALAELEDSEGIDLGYNYPPTGNGNAMEESGLPRGVVRAVAAIVAKALAPEIGKTLSPQATGSYARSLDILRSTYRTVPQMQLGRQTIVGAGNRWARRTAFFLADDGSDAGLLDGDATVVV
jgi:hypothetical protein